ncbi:unnamed protein product, partial [Ectocarpus sp. 12 AP-2014]
MASSPSHEQRRSKKLMLSTIDHNDAQEKPRFARAAAAASSAAGQNYAGTLPPSFTKPFRSHHHHHRHQPHHAPPLFITSRPRATLASATVSEAAAPQILQVANSLATLGGVGSLLSPQNNALHANFFSSGRRSNILPRKRPRTSSHLYGRDNNDFINEIPDLLRGSPAPAHVSPIRARKRNGNMSGDGGSLWGLSGVPPTGVIDPRTSAEPLETEWACPTSSVATSTSSLHDGFSDVFATPVPGGSRRAALQPHPSRFKVVPGRLSRSAEGLTRPRSGVRNYPMESLGNWPLNTTERWMKAIVTQDTSQERLDKLREIRLQRIAERERKRAAWTPVADSSSDSGDSYVSEEEPEVGGGDEEGREETEQEKEKRRKLKKAIRKKARRAKKKEAEMKSRSNRGRWQTAGRHGGLVARAKASVPSLATRGDLVQLKGHADRVLMGKIAR